MGEGAVVAGDSAEPVIVRAYHPNSRREVEHAGDETGREAFRVDGSAPGEDGPRATADHARSAGARAVGTVAVLGEPVGSPSGAAERGSTGLLVVEEPWAGHVEGAHFGIGPLGDLTTFGE
ncbi:universal stress protein [Actinopolyspora saharensis]|uniref:universal stress protein n=1 Tax=Actinopolyspora saharensis TaxID=995062 RepID=UPI003F6730C1